MEWLALGCPLTRPKSLVPGGVKDQRWFLVARLGDVQAIRTGSHCRIDARVQLEFLVAQLELRGVEQALTVVATSVGESLAIRDTPSRCPEACAETEARSAAARHLILLPRGAASQG